MAEDHSPETILEQALDLSDSQKRAAYLDQACGEDQALRHEVESLLAAHFAANSDFMDTLVDPVWQEAATEKEGDSIGRYKLLQQIGEGGFGTVYLLGAALLGQKRFEEAEPLLESGYQGMGDRAGQIPPGGWIAVPTALKALISFYEMRGAEGDAGKAAAYGAELEEKAKGDKSEK